MTIITYVRTRRVALSLVAVVSVACIVTQAHGGADTESHPLADLQRRIDKVLKVGAPATVQIKYFEKNWKWVSGVIVTEDGYIATCWHHHQPFGTQAIVRFSDGKEVKAQFLGGYRQWDVNLAKITEEGIWPKVELGQSRDRRVGELCIALGYPAETIESGSADDAKDANVVVRLGQILLTSAAPGNIRSSCRIEAGDSGGPLLDLDGRLIGITTHQGGHLSDWGGSGFGSGFAGAELFKENWKHLVAGTMENQRYGISLNEFRAALDSSRTGVVEVLAEGQVLALGTVVRSDGLILTKASSLCGKISCRLRDGREVLASVFRTAPEEDLALLKLNVSELTPIQWSQVDVPSVGVLIASPTLRAETDKVGVISYGLRPIPGVAGWFPANVSEEPNGGGMKVTKVRPEPESPLPIEVGDIITEVNGIPTPDLQTWVHWTEQSPMVGKQPRFGGEVFSIKVRRADQSINLQVALFPGKPKNHFTPNSPRRSGFSSVFSTDAGVIPEMCGGPVVDADGIAIGINIARSDQQNTFVIPSSIVQKRIGEMLAQ